MHMKAWVLKLYLIRFKGRRALLLEDYYKGHICSMVLVNYSDNLIFNGWSIELTMRDLAGQKKYQEIQKISLQSISIKQTKNDHS